MNIRNPREYASRLAFLAKPLLPFGGIHSIETLVDEHAQTFGWINDHIPLFADEMDNYIIGSVISHCRKRRLLIHVYNEEICITDGEGLVFWQNGTRADSFLEALDGFNQKRKSS